ncbi:MAG: malto-oligosyltrehalose synthase [Rhodococcus sp. (in: high G+C Gram-positive bacteria)]|uniref:malto-oligosyltrehalose synthase n=1 Tax=Rhodococcus sp. TaxID=1831 RepID=UPI003BB78C88
MEPPTVRRVPGTPIPVTATYRLQLRGDALRFDDAAELVDYLDELGISHLYLSPVLTAATGSTHGYDVTDPSTVSEALGGRAGLDALADRARSRGMGLVIDIVPNHVGVADARQNRWWWDVLQHGQSSRYATHFDIDVAPDNGSDGKIALPALGAGDGPGDLTVDRSGPEPMLAYYDKLFPIAPGTDSGTATEIHTRQVYRLVPWNAGLVGYRRFFTIDDLAAVRVEDPVVFDDAHEQVRAWVDGGLIDGIRVDHPDGLADPAEYLIRLRALLGPDRWLVVEKILGAAEPLDPTLPVDGTTGYDALNELAAVFVDPRGESVLTELSRRCTGAAEDAAWFHQQEVQSKREVLAGGLAPEVRRLVRVVRRNAEAAGVEAESVREAVIAVAAALPVYRADYAPLAGLLPRVVGEVSDSRPDLEPALRLVARALAAQGEAAARFGQVCGAATAKAVEDRLFYRASRLISLQEVGGQPGRFAMPVSQFQLAWHERARRWPRTMTTLSTHDTKRSEDVRARISVLSQVAAQWAAHLAAWDGAVPSPDPAIGSFLWQTLFGVWPEDGVVTAELRDRIHEYVRKALRENGTRTTWTNIDDGFETAVAAWIDAIVSGPVSDALTAFVGATAPHVAAVSLGQKLLQLLGPGIPDVYQGTELWDDSLVDPDNRRPVDFDARRRLLADPNAAPAKFRVVREALRLRRARPASFVGGAYVPLLASGPAAGHVLAFGRGPAAADLDVAAVAILHTARVREAGWDGTLLDLPPGTWTDRLTGRTLTGSVPLGEVVGVLPVAALERSR